MSEFDPTQPTTPPPEQGIPPAVPLPNTPASPSLGQPTDPAPVSAKPVFGTPLDAPPPPAIPLAPQPTDLASQNLATPPTDPSQIPLPASPASQVAPTSDLQNPDATPTPQPAQPTSTPDQPPSTKKFNSFLAFIIAAGVLVVGLIVGFSLLIFFNTRSDDTPTSDTDYSNGQPDQDYPDHPDNPDEDEDDEDEEEIPEDPAAAALRRDNQRRADLDRVMSQITAFQARNGGNVPNTNFNTLPGQPTLNADIYFLDAFLYRASGHFRTPTGVDYGFVTDTSGRAATTDTFAHSGPGFRCLGNNFTGEHDLTGNPILIINPRESIAIRLRLENGTYLCRDLNTRVIPR